MQRKGPVLSLHGAGMFTNVMQSVILINFLAQADPYSEDFLDYYLSMPTYENNIVKTSHNTYNVASGSVLQTPDVPWQMKQSIFVVCLEVADGSKCSSLCVEKYSL